VLHFYTVITVYEASTRELLVLVLIWISLFQLSTLFTGRALAHADALKRCGKVLDLLVVNCGIEDY
jgi:hypothetical protein